MNIVPYFGRSIYDDIDCLFDDLLWDGHRGLALFPAQNRRNRNAHGAAKNWVASVRLPQFKKEDISIEFGENNSTVNIHAKHDQGDGQYDEVKRIIKVPDTVKRSDIKTELTKDGILLIKAPYIQQQNFTNLMPWGFDSVMPVEDWGELTKEMEKMRNELNQLTQDSTLHGSGSMLPRVIRDKDGKHKMSLSFDLHGYKPEEVQISQNKDRVTVEANHKDETEHGFVSKHYKREFKLPENVKVDELQSRLLQNGQLELEAPCQFNDEVKQIQGHSIPVNRS
jgi:HSP20 family molecular chaperone IbpA